MKPRRTSSLLVIASIVLVVLSATVVIAAFISISTFNTLVDYEHDLDRISDQRGDVLQLTSLAQLVVDTQDSQQIKDYLTQINSLLAETSDRNQEILDQGTGGDATIVAALDPLNQQWQTFHDTVTRFLNADPANYGPLSDQLTTMGVSISHQLDGPGDRYRDLYDLVQEASQRQIDIVVGLSLLVDVLAIIGLGRLLAPLRRLVDLTQLFARGNFGVRAPVSGVYEVVELATAFNSLAESVQTRDKELTKANASLTAQAQILQNTNRSLQLTTTELAEARDRAEEANQVKSAFLASMSHELRTPLNSIINFTKFVKRGVMGPVTERQEEALGTAIDSAVHLLNLINDVLDISKIESGSLNLFIEDNISLTDLLTKAVAACHSLIAEKPVKLLEEVPADLPTVSADRQRIYQIMLNILSNACKFTEEGNIWVKAQFNDNEILISVKDTGPGIAPEDQSLVFESFKQTDVGLRQGSGTGLGMPISKRLAEAHGGRLWLESEPGHGATFFVALPIKTPAPVLELR